jgi:competence protein ComEC
MQLLGILRKSPFFRLLVFYAVGIHSSGFIRLNESQVFVVIALTAMLIAIMLLLYIRLRLSFHTNWVSGLLTGIALFLLGLLNMNLHLQKTKQINEAGPKSGILAMQITESPEIREKNVRVAAKIEGSMTDGRWNNERQKIMAYFAHDSVSEYLKPGDLILANTSLIPIPGPGNPGEFDYRGYMAARQVYNHAFIKSGDWKTVNSRKNNSVQILAMKIRDSLLRSFMKIGLNKTMYGILSAITLGYRNDLDVQTRQIFSKAGIMHVMALSGFNVAVIALALGYLLGFLERSFSGKVMKTTVIILFIWLFAFITGLSPSVVRASVMISFVMTGGLFQKQINTYNTLFASAFMMLLFSPALLTDISFQLSFTAVLGIVAYQPVFDHMVTFKNIWADKVWKLFTVSCAAQFSTMPLALYYFHQFPVYFWLTNLYVVPCVSLLICLALVFLMVAWINPLAFIIGKILTVMLKGLYWSVSLVEILPFSLIENIKIQQVQAIILLLLILCLGIYIIHKCIGFLRVSLLFLLGFQIFNIVSNYSFNHQHMIVVGKIPKKSVITIISGRESVLLSDTAVNTDATDAQYAFGNFWVDHKVIKKIKSINLLMKLSEDEILCRDLHQIKGPGHNLLFEFEGRRFAFLCDDILFDYHAHFPLKVDYLIISDKIIPDLERLNELFIADSIILDSTVKGNRVNQWMKSCEEKGISCWDIDKKGAFILKL